MTDPELTAVIVRGLREVAPESDPAALRPEPQQPQAPAGQGLRRAVKRHKGGPGTAAATPSSTGRPEHRDDLW